MPVIVAAEQPALGFGDLEYRSADGDPQVGPLDQHEAAAHRIAVDRGNDRFLERPGHERVLDRRPLPAGHPALQRLPHVLAGAEASTGPGENRDLELVAMTEFGPGLGEPGAHFLVER